MPDTFKNRLIKAMEIRNMKAVDLSKATGLSKARISQYVNGVYEAKQQALYALSTALNVSEAWLMGYDTNMEKINSDELDEQRDTSVLNGQSNIFAAMKKIMPDVYELLMEYNDLNEEGKKEAILRVRELGFLPKYKKDADE